MELVTGTSLEADPRFGQPAWAVPVLAQVAQALAAMHAQGIIHRDLKPSNVMLQEGQVKVADFGIASFLGEGAHGAHLTQTGAVIGTPLYLAPELAVGPRVATAAADIFSLGVMAFQLLSGRLPIAVAPIRELLANRPLSAFESLQTAVPGAPPALARLLTACLKSDPGARPTAAEVAATLGEWTGPSFRRSQARRKPGWLCVRKGRQERKRSREACTSIAIFGHGQHAASVRVDLRAASLLRSE
jgi:serine/threonine protein kinase